MAYSVTLDSTNNLVALDQTKHQLGLDPDTTHDDDYLITDLINMASVWFNSQCQRQLKSRSQTEYHDYPENDFLLYLNHPPVASVTLYNNADVPRAFGTDDEVSSDDYEVYTEDNIGKIILTGTTFLPGRRTIKVTYTGGFSTIPTDLKLACVDLVAHWYHMRNNQGFAVTAHNRPEGSGVTFDKALPLTVQQAVRRYMRYGCVA